MEEQMPNNAPMGQTPPQMGGQAPAPGPIDHKRKGAVAWTVALLAFAIVAVGVLAYMMMSGSSDTMEADKMVADEAMMEDDAMMEGEAEAEVEAGTNPFDNEPVTPLDEASDNPFDDADYNPFN